MSNSLRICAFVATLSPPSDRSRGLLVLDLSFYACGPQQSSRQHGLLFFYHLPCWSMRGQCLLALGSEDVSHRRRAAMHFDVGRWQ